MAVSVFSSCQFDFYCINENWSLNQYYKPDIRLFIPRTSVIWKWRDIDRPTVSLTALKACPHCRRKVRLSHKTETVAENGKIRRQSHLCETMSLLWDSLTFLQQCGQAITTYCPPCYSTGPWVFQQYIIFSLPYSARSIADDTYKAPRSYSIACVHEKYSKSYWRRFRDIYMYVPQLTGKPEQQRFTFKVAYWPALALSSAAQLPPPISSGSKYLHLLVFNLLTAAAGKVRSAFCEAVTITQTFSQEHNAHAPVISY